MSGIDNTGFGSFLTSGDQTIYRGLQKDQYQTIYWEPPSDLQKDIVSFLPPSDLQKNIVSFLPPSDSKIFLRELVSQSLSNKDCEKVIGMLVEYLSKEDRNIKLDENIETSILSFYIDKA